MLSCLMNQLRLNLVILDEFLFVQLSPPYFVVCSEFMCFFFFLTVVSGIAESRSRQDEISRRLKMSDGQKFQLGTIGALSLSVVSSVSIVICNKALISTLGFTFGELLNIQNLDFTSFNCVILNRFHVRY